MMAVSAPDVDGGAYASARGFIIHRFALQPGEVMETVVPLVDSPNVVIGVYRFTHDEEDRVLLLGAAG